MYIHKAADNPHVCQSGALHLPPVFSNNRWELACEINWNTISPDPPSFSIQIHLYCEFPYCECPASPAASFSLTWCECIMRVLKVLVSHFVYLVLPALSVQLLWVSSLTCSVAVRVRLTCSDLSMYPDPTAVSVTTWFEPYFIVLCDRRQACKQILCWKSRLSTTCQFSPGNRRKFTHIAAKKPVLTWFLGVYSGVECSASLALTCCESSVSAFTYCNNTCLTCLNIQSYLPLMSRLLLWVSCITCDLQWVLGLTCREFLGSPAMVVQSSLL